MRCATPHPNLYLLSLWERTEVRVSASSSPSNVPNNAYLKCHSGQRSDARGQ